MDFSGQTVLITGASRGIGAAAAEHLATLGAQVVLTARSEAELAKLAEKMGPKALAIACDIADFAQVQAAVDQTVARFGRLDIVVNNAGMLLPVHRMADFEAADWDRVIDVNVKGVFYMMKAALPIMTAQGGGTILNISSGAAYGVLEGWSHYCASKAAVLQLTRSGHAEYGDQGIRCLGLSPGTVATQMQVEIKATGVNPVSQLELSDHIAASDVAQAIAYLCGPGGADYAGEDFHLREPASRALVGLPPR
ncbi:SDR family oxidoreductase [Planktomarina temperata]|nr:SDR family oxidoreductase [Planktomarina temperata]